MDKAKQAVTDFMSHKDEHKTVVDQDHRAAVTEEHIRPERHEQITTAIDKEIHQDHHQTIIQPIKHAERLPEKHTHNAIPVEHKTFEHDKPEASRALLDEDAARYRDSSVTHDTIMTSAQAPSVTGEHVHHHLHQHIQPVIEKDTIAPEVVHTTVPIHETHHAPTVSHGTTTLPAKTLAEFEKDHAGLLKGRGPVTVGEFDGCAKSFAEGTHSIAGSKTSTTGAATRDPALQRSSLPGSGVSGSAAQTRGAKSMIDPVDGGRAGTESKRAPVDGANDYKVANESSNQNYKNDSSSVPRSSRAAVGTAAGVGGGAALGAGANALRTSDTGKSDSSRNSKVSLKDKLNPFKDADGDGKKGIMS